MMDFDTVILCANLCLFSFDELNDPIVKDAYDNLDLNIDTAQNIIAQHAEATISITKHKERKHVYIAWTGTDEIADWQYNFNTSSFNAILNKLPIGKVHRGMWNYYQTICEKIDTHIKKLINEGYSRFIFTGYSLGCSVIFSALETKMKYNSTDLECYLFASPKIGDKYFMEVINSFIPRYMHIVLHSDIVPSFPFYSNLIQLPKTYVIYDKNLPNSYIKYFLSIFSIFILRTPTFITTHYISNYLKYINKLPNSIPNVMRIGPRDEYNNN